MIPFNTTRPQGPKLKGSAIMSSRKLRVERIEIVQHDESSKILPTRTEVKILFSRKLTALEVSGVKAVLDGELK
jgi:hypothetical protein